MHIITELKLPKPQQNITYSYSTQYANPFPQINLTTPQEAINCFDKAIEQKPNDQKLSAILFNKALVITLVIPSESVAIYDQEQLSNINNILPHNDVETSGAVHVDQVDIA